MNQSVTTVKPHYSVTASWTAVCSSFPTWNNGIQGILMFYFSFRAIQIYNLPTLTLQQKYLWLSNFLTYAFMVSISIFISVNLERKQFEFYVW